MGYSEHAGMAVTCDGTDYAMRRIGKDLWNDPAAGVRRHADAGYKDAIQCACSHGSAHPGITAIRD